MRVQCIARGMQFFFYLPFVCAQHVLGMTRQAITVSLALHYDFILRRVRLWKFVIICWQVCVSNLVGWTYQFKYDSDFKVTKIERHVNFITFNSVVKSLLAASVDERLPYWADTSPRVDSWEEIIVWYTFMSLVILYVIWGCLCVCQLHPRYRVP